MYVCITHTAIALSGVSVGVGVEEDSGGISGRFVRCCSGR